MSHASLYVPLRVHGQHSLLTGVDAPRAIVAHAKRRGFDALALTDTDCQAGLVDFLRAAHDEGIRPIVGAELTDPNAAGRVIALVKNAEGYRNLCRLISARKLGDDPGSAGDDLPGPEHFDLIHACVRFQEGLILLADHPRLLIGLFERVPREDIFAAISPGGIRTGYRRALEDRARHGETRNAYVSRPQRRTQPRRHKRPLDDEPQGADLELPKTRPPAHPIDAIELIEAARATGVATLAVPDVYHLEPGGARDHRVRVAIKHNALIDDLDPGWLAHEPAHLIEGEELARLFAELPDVCGPYDELDRNSTGKLPGALARTFTVAERCNFTPELGGVLFPDIELDPDESAYSKLCELAFEGLRRRYKPLRPEVVRRLDYELTTIDQLGFSPYFLLVNSIADFARDNKIPCVGRGSAADSLVAYALGLTEADPFRYDLPFERFLNPARSDRPDIDLDFCCRRRDEVLEHVYELFGPERTAMISTLNSFGLRSAFRESALVAGLPPAEVNRWTRHLPWALPHDEPHGEPHDRTDTKDQNPIAHALASTPETRDFPLQDERYRAVLTAAARLIDTPRHFGLHPGGVVVSPGKITDHVACQRAAKGCVVTQFDKNAVESIGLVKMDLLGNRALTVVADCVEQLASNGVKLDPLVIPEDDPDTAQTLREGRTLGCFQIESPGMRNLLQQSGAATMDDVIQAVALIRPGPSASGMKDAYVRRFRGLEPREAPHPRLSEILWDNYGILIYQEDVMRVAARMAGLEMHEADQLRRALQKRRHEELEPLARRFAEGCRDEGVERADVERIWELITNFASFAFCKAHAITYGQIAYRTAWLKTHYPALFLTAFLRSETGYYKPRVYVEEARRLGVAILGPDVNRSHETFAIERIMGEACLRIGLRQVKGITQRTLERILAGRAEAPYLSLPDFLERTEARTDEVEHLIQSGAFDAFDRTRPELLWRLHLLRQPSRKPPTHKQLLQLDSPDPLDARGLSACRETPTVRSKPRPEFPKSGWSGQSLGLRGLDRDLPPGASAMLFPDPPPESVALPALPELDPETRGRIEFELLGLTVHLHPTHLFPCPADARIARHKQKALRLHGTGADTSVGHGRPLLPAELVTCRSLARVAGARVSLRGWPAATRRVRTSDGRWMRFLTLEDESGLAEVIVFPDIYERDGHHLSEFGSLIVTGVARDHLGAVNLEAERIW